jgi:hypothetical protein
MFDNVGSQLDSMSSVVDQLSQVDLSSLNSAELLEATRRWDRLDRQSAAVRHRLIAEIDQRHLAVEVGHKHTVALLRDLCNLTPGVARRRVELARALGPGRSLSGGALPPVFAQTAEAALRGELSADHARVIIATVDRLPHGVAAESDVAVEKELVAQAVTLDPGQLARLGRRVVDHLDPDGILRDEAYRERTRDLTLCQRADGSVHGSFDLTASCGERLLTVLDSLARPLPAADGSADPRTPGQRRHDGFEDALDRLLRDGGLPATGGVSTTVLLTISEDQVRERIGLARTGHGALISVRQALQLAADAKVVPVVFAGADELASYGSAQRLASASQRYALVARDKGCSFPGCDAPPAWTQAHHMIEHQLGGPTSVENMALLCGSCHRMFDRLGWRGTMIDGLPHWIPPPWIDPDQVPRLNAAHG